MHHVYHRRNAFRTIVAVAVIGLVLAPNAHAYIDGGTASMLFQMLVAGLVASLLFVKMWFRRAKRFVLRLIGQGGPAETAVATEDSSAADD